MSAHLTRNSQCRMCRYRQLLFLTSGIAASGGHFGRRQSVQRIRTHGNSRWTGNDEGRKFGYGVELWKSYRCGIRWIYRRAKTYWSEVVPGIDGTGSMQYVVDDVKAKMKRLVLVLHQLVPTAKIGIVVYGGRGEPLSVQPLTPSSETIAGFLSQLEAHNGGAWQEDLFSAVNTAVLKMNWQLSSHKVIVLIGDTPPFDEDYAAGAPSCSKV